MAYRIRLYADLDWVPDGAGGAAVGVAMANNPGLGAVGNAQTMRLQQVEYVPGADAPSGANFQTALNNGATDLYAQITASVLATLQAWATGNP